VTEEAGRSGNGARPVQVVALATFPVEAAATRLRIAQYLSPLAEAGIDVTLLPFLTAADFQGLYDRKRLVRTAFRLFLATFRRLIQLPRILGADVLLVQREAMLFGPPWIEWLAVRVARVPLVLDLDDATWMVMDSPVYGRLAAALKFAGKTDWLIRHARAVICGNETIAAYVRGAGAEAVVIPSMVDTAVFSPAARTPDGDGRPLVGWIGTHGTWSYLEAILPILEAVAQSVPFRLRIVGSGRESLSLRGVEVELLTWRMEREVDDFRSLDVGLYPLPTGPWPEAKSGLKAFQYLACGVPYVASPVGVVRDIGEPDVTHFLARTPDEWRTMLERLLRDRNARERMGAAGRRYMLEHDSIGDLAQRLAAVLHDAAAKGNAAVYP
jgi:glycosyltransferase involved in cell wall biosynthesis